MEREVGRERKREMERNRRVKVVVWVGRRTRTTPCRLRKIQY